MTSTCHSRLATTSFIAIGISGFLGDTYHEASINTICTAQTQEHIGNLILLAQHTRPSPKAHIIQQPRAQTIHRSQEDWDEQDVEVWEAGFG